MRQKMSFWDYRVGDLLTDLCEPRLWTNKIVAIALKGKAFYLHIILNSAIPMKWKPDLMNELKTMNENGAPCIF